MRNTLIDISDKIAPSIVNILSLIKDIAEKNKVDFFVAGATARDIILNIVYGIKVPRATNDIDFAIRIDTWEQFDSITVDLIRNGFEKTNIVHRFKYRSFPVDFIPFGGISVDESKFKWPDKEEKEMSVLGFEEVHENVELIKVKKEPETIIKFASVEGLTILKFVSWAENPTRSPKDANDLLLIMKTYIDAGNLERLMNEHEDLVDETFDYEIIGARLLGRDVAKIAKSNTIDFIRKILNDEIENRGITQLALEMSRYEFAFEKSKEKTEFALQLLKNFKIGLEDRYNESD